MTGTKCQSAALALSGVGHAYGQRRALHEVSLRVPGGSFTALLGPNGAGKTTLFGLISRLLGLQEGRIEICGTDVRAGARALAPLGLVFQQPTLDLDLTVRQNLAYFARLRGLSGAEAERRLMHELDRLNMAERVGERVRELNGGHRRRVELARALIDEPRLLVLDEPTVGLDVDARKRITEHVHDLARHRGIAVLWATHLIDEVAPDDALVVLAAGQVVAQGDVEAVLKEAGATDLGEAFAALTHSADALASVSSDGARAA